MPLDIGVGILLALGIHVWLGVPLSAFLICFGIFSALFPDSDIVTAFFGKWRHRGITHYPFVYVPVSIFLFASAPFAYALLFTLGVYAHLIHDTIGIGWGIKWLWPFSKRTFLIFPERARRNVLGRFVSWMPEDDARIRTQHYPGGSGNWVRDFYFRPNTLAYIEYVVLAVALITLFSFIW